MNFEDFLKEWSGRDIEYHRRAGTWDLEFGRDCWIRAQEVERERCAILCENLRFVVGEADKFDCAHAIRFQYLEGSKP